MGALVESQVKKHLKLHEPDDPSLTYISKRIKEKTMHNGRWVCYIAVKGNTENRVLSLLPSWLKNAGLWALVDPSTTQI